MSASAVLKLIACDGKADCMNAATKLQNQKIKDTINVQFQNRTDHVSHMQIHCLTSNENGLQMNQNKPK